VVTLPGKKPKEKQLGSMIVPKRGSEMHDALTDAPDPKDVERGRERRIGVMSNDYERLRSLICVGLGPTTDISREARTLRDDMRSIEQELSAANVPRPAVWDDWDKLFDMLEQLKKISCAR